MNVPETHDIPEALFETSDLHVAAFLACRGFMLKKIINQRGRILFGFRESAKLRETLLDYLNDGTVSAREFGNTLRDLKGLARGEARSG